jgi:hypothetical protein
LVTPRIDLRYMPDIRFRIDTSLDYAEKIDRILSDPSVARDLASKDEVREVQAGQECGMAFEGYQDMRAGDVIECFRVEKVQRTLD